MALNILQDPQLELINSLEGIHLVDAGAGTGKTYSIVKRYGNIIEKNVKPENLLLITFTRNAAEQMKQEVIRKLSGAVSISKLLEAPIMTFHSFCSRILKKSGTVSPSYLGLNEYLPKNFNLIEDSSFEEEVFRKFFLDFSASNKSKYQDILYALEGEHATVLKVIKKLSSFGIFPTTKGWKKEDIEKITGNYKLFCDRFDMLNERVQGVKGAEIQNKLYKAFYEFLGDKLYLDLNRENIFLDKSIDPDIKEILFNDVSRDDYFEFLRDIYIEYIEHLLQRNLLNYESLVMFAYLILYNDKTVRNNNQFDYVMIDEFQDTDEIQFKLIMLMCKNINDSANLCVVGDWKQGIYSFRNTQIENITEFARNMQKYKEELNADETRITYDTGEHKKITFDTNYRSSETILKFSKTTLLIKGKDDEEVDAAAIEKNFEKSLTPARELEDLTEIEFYRANNRIDEYRLVLKKISELVSNHEKYRIRIFDKATGKVIEERPVKYSDICVLSRTKRFCLELQREANRFEIPVNYGGGLELFASEQGVLVLAWLRLTANDKDLFGWLPVLDKEGYNYPEINFFKENFIDKRNDYKLFSDLPEELSEFIKKLRALKNNILYAVEAILSRYGYHDEIGNKIITVIQSWMNSDLISLNDLIQIIDNSANAEFKIEPGYSSDAVLTQTIHISKGLEYPVVILSNVNIKNFPGNKGDADKLIYDPVGGLRSKIFYTFNGRFYYKFNNWRTDLVNTVCKISDYDEERRLLYVAVTRAKQYVYFTAFNPSPFFKELSAKTGREIITDFDHEIIPSQAANQYSSVEIKADSQQEKRKRFISTHAIMDEIIKEEDSAQIDAKSYSIKTSKIKLDFGSKVHNIAHRLTSGLEVESDIVEVQRLKNFILNLKANELRSEVDFLYPKEDKVIRGIIDLIAFYDDRIEVIDYKTDKNKKNLERYNKQIEIYKEVVGKIYKGKKIIGKIYFVSLDEIVSS